MKIYIPALISLCISISGIFYIKIINTEASSDVRYFFLATSMLFILSLYNTYSKKYTYKKLLSSHTKQIFLRAFALGVAINIIIDAFIYFVWPENLNFDFFNIRLIFYSSVNGLVFSTIEEIIFRGIILNVLLKFSKFFKQYKFLLFVTVLESTIFLISHMHAGKSGLYYTYVFFTGVLLTCMALKYKSLWPGIGLHFGIDVITSINSGVHFLGFKQVRGVLTLDQTSVSFYFLLSTLFSVGMTVFIFRTFCTIFLNSPRDENNNSIRVE